MVINAKKMIKYVGEIKETISYNGKEAHSEDIVDIVSSPPHRLLQWGITWVFLVLLGTIILSAFVRYPDIVRAPIRINTTNAPKAVVSKISGNITTILVDENDSVTAGQSLAWMESTANHQQAMELLHQLQKIRETQIQRDDETILAVNAPTYLELGELQGGYQTFYQSYLTYKAAIGDGIFLKRKKYLLQDMANIQELRKELETQLALQKHEYKLAEIEFDRYKKLSDRKVISPAEYQQQQAVLIAKEYPLQQTRAAMLANDASQTSKTREMADLNNQINEERSKFLQALNSFISEIEQWKIQHVLSAPVAGTVVYAGIIQRNQHINAGQEVFHVNPGGTNFFGEINIPQYNLGKVELGQKVLIKLDSYPFEEFGILKGTVSQLTNMAIRDSLFLSKASIDSNTIGNNIQLRTGLIGTAEIVTEDVSILHRLLRNLRLVLSKNT